MNETNPAANASGNAAKSEVGRVATTSRLQYLRLEEREARTRGDRKIAEPPDSKVQPVTEPVSCTEELAVATDQL